jgi:hypothetical protein
LIIFILYYNVITKSADPKRGAGKKEKKNLLIALEVDGLLI